MREREREVERGGGRHRGRERESIYVCVEREREGERGRERRERESREREGGEPLPPLRRRLPLPSPFLTSLFSFTMRLLLLCLAATSLAFECDSGRLLPPSHLNDGYCDCADRTDEPRTGACPDTSFVCTNWPDVRVRLPASRVGDGVCDCCDGSDEPDGRCEETCVENAARRAALLERACLQRAELAREGREGVEKDAAKLEQARALLEERAPEIDVLRDAMESASAQEAAMLAERQARLESGELDRALGIERLTNPMLLVALARLALASGIDGVDNLYDTILSRSEFGGECGMSSQWR